jgi:WD40 repeat protein
MLSGHCDCIFQGHSRAVTDVCWLATWNQVVSASTDHTARIWDVQKQTCLKIFSQYHHWVTAIASSPSLLLVALQNGTVNIYDSQSGDIIHVIKFDNRTHSCFSVDGGKVLLASRNSGAIWDITTKTLTHVRSIQYNGEHARFSPDGNRVASIYGKFLKIWKTNAGNNHHKASTPGCDTIDDIYISPDEQLVTLKSKMGANILDATTGQSLLTYPITHFLSIGFSPDLKFVAFLNFSGTVEIWDAHIHFQKSIIIDDDVFHIALASDGSQLASLSSSHMELWDLKSGKLLAHLKFNRLLQRQAQISFSTKARSVFILKNSDGPQSWCIFPNHNIECNMMEGPNSENHITNRYSWLISRSSNAIQTRNCTKNRDGTRLPMVFVPTTEEWSNQGAFAPYQCYRCDTDDEWILDQDGRQVLWIPPDERPRKFLCFEYEKKVLILTEGGKVYFVKFS